VPLFEKNLGFMRLSEVARKHEVRFEVSPISLGNCPRT
jgi:hypothetical protein